MTNDIGDRVFRSAKDKTPSQRKLKDLEQSNVAYKNNLGDTRKSDNK